MPSLPDRIGPYRPLQRIGAGGMGTVYYAYHPDSGQPLAVKVLHEDHARDRDHRKRFAREAAALRKVTGPYLVPLIDADPEAERPWLATPYVPGNTLHEHIRDHGKLTPGNLLTFAAATAHALACIHAAGIAHRDLKPPNVILAADGPRVVDFGIAHLLDATAVTATRVNTGTRGWMAPEQLRTGITTTASDVYAWGVLVAFAASGKHPYGPPTGIEFRMERGDEYTLEGIPDRLAEQVHAALQMDPDARPLAADLADTVAGMYGPQGTTVFPTMEFTRIAEFIESDYVLPPPVSRWDVPVPARDLSRDIQAPPVPPTPVAPPVPGYGPAPQMRPRLSFRARTHARAASGGYVPGLGPYSYRAPRKPGDRIPIWRWMTFVSKLTLATTVTAGVLAWAIYAPHDDGTADAAAPQQTAAVDHAGGSDELGSIDGPDDGGPVYPSPSPTPTLTPSPTASASPSAIYPETDRNDMVFAEETGRDKESILFDPNPKPFEFHGDAICGMDHGGSTDADRRKCSMNITNGTRAPIALVCTVPYRDDLSGNEDFREGDPQPDTGTMTFMTPVVPARYNMGVEFSLPKGKYRSLSENKTVCELAHV
ncbi:serine/threonine protein kinase [Streptomyces sp. 5.8]|uniref:serine/threonine protein kinase n=1 Tax=Streptomyces sp. 5.8 TaxID=3406571 RepID=UPI003BB6EA49